MILLHLSDGWNKQKIGATNLGTEGLKGILRPGEAPAVNRVNLYDRRRRVLPCLYPPTRTQLPQDGRIHCLIPARLVKVPYNASVTHNSACHQGERFTRRNRRTRT